MLERTGRPLRTAKAIVSPIVHSPRDFGSIAVPAPDVAPHEADKNVPLADPRTLSLNGRKYFVYACLFHILHNTEKSFELQGITACYQKARMPEEG